MLGMRGCSVIVLMVAALSGVLAQLDVLRATTSRCTSNVQCPSHASCVPQGFCLCDKGYVYLEDLCVPVATKLGDSCVADVQCEVSFGADAECAVSQETVGASCRCEQNSHFADNKCHKTALLGEKCSTRSDCYSTSGANVYCVYSKCTCHQGFHPNQARDDCLEDKALGQTCGKEDDCVAINSTCYDKCSCRVGFVAASDNLRCLPVAHELGEGCELDAQCLQFLPLSACRSQTCACQEGSHQNQARCWRSKKLGESCDDWRQCVTVSNISSAVSCDSTGRCACSSGYSPNPQRDDCLSNSTLLYSRTINFYIIVILSCIYFTK